MNLNQLTPEVMMAKAKVASGSARLLMGRGDPDGAVNLAYNAIMNAVKVAVLASAAPAELARIGSQKELMDSVACYLVHHAFLPRDMERLIDRAGKLRYRSNHFNESVDAEEASKIVDNAAILVQAIESVFLPGGPGGGKEP